ncbi:hypothetical protein Taitung233_14910 [Helicobacter pylori]
MKQKVHSVSYLAKAEFELKDGVYDLVALPTGAEVVKVSLEVAGNLKNSKVDIGFKDESTKDYFLSSLIAPSDKYDVRTITSVRDYTATSNNVVVAVVRESENQIDAKCVLRVVYFLPSVIEVEY